MRSGHVAREVQHTPTTWKTSKNFASLVALTFLPDLISSYSQLWKKNSCSVKLQGAPLDHNPRKIPLEYFIFNKFVNYSCLMNCTEN